MTDDKTGRHSQITTDEELLLLLHDPEMESLGAELFVRKYESFCTSLAARWGDDDGVVRDIANDVLARFIERETSPVRASFQQGLSIAAYLAVSIRNAFRDHFRRRQREPEIVLSDSDGLESIASSEMLPLDRLILSEQRIIVERCLTRLRPEEFHLLTLRFAEEPPKKLQQIADELDLVPSTVSYRIDKALGHLRQLLEEAGVRGAFNAGSE